MPYILAGNYEEYRFFLTKHGLASSTLTYVSKPEQLVGYHGPIVLIGTFIKSDLWDLPEIDEAFRERRIIFEDVYVELFKGAK